MFNRIHFLQTFDVIVLSAYAAFTAAIPALIDKYIFRDWHFATALLIAIGVDTIIKLISEFKKGTLHSGKFGKLFMKLVVYGLALIVVHNINDYLMEQGKDLPYFIDLVKYMGAAIYLGMLFRELLSINENMAALGFRLLPKFITKRLETFDTEGNIN